MTDLHFSPRPNRAHEIHWKEWSPDTFARAKSEDKPILLAISAVWCHWCHVMDETTYSDDAVIAKINDRFIPIRVDNDVRPDINARYNMGGWPTTAFLTPEGATITGATYLSADQMHRALDEIAQFYAANKLQISERSRELRERRVTYTLGSRDALALSIIEHVLAQLKRAYDPVHGGFGNNQKFPQPEALALLLQEYRVTGDAQLLDMLTTTLHNMASGGMYDHVEGGFFRYSTTPDWSIPHFEKMAEDHAGLLRVLADFATLGTDSKLKLTADDAHRVASEHNPWIAGTLRSATEYVRTVLRDPQTGFFAGSQDADEAYFAKPLEERRAMQAPFVDRRSYSDWTASLAGAFFAVARAFGYAGDFAMAERVATEAQETLDTMYTKLRDSDGLLYHLTSPSGNISVQGLFGDQVAYVRALLDAHDYAEHVSAGETPFLKRAVAHAEATIAHFAAPDGGFYDRVAIAEQLGNLAIPDRPIVDNGLFAEALLRLAMITGEQRFHDTAERTLLVYTQTYEKAGSFAATYARAVRRYLTPGLCTERGCI